MDFGSLGLRVGFVLSNGVPVCIHTYICVPGSIIRYGLVVLEIEGGKFGVI